MDRLGEADIYLDGGTEVKLVCKDKDGVEIWTAENVTAPWEAPPTASKDTFQAYDHKGNVLAGGLVHTYAGGTTTPETTYTTDDLGTPNDNPVVLDAAGQADIFRAKGPDDLKIVLQTAAGRPILTRELWPPSDMAQGRKQSLILSPKSAEVDIAIPFAFSPLDMTAYGWGNSQLFLSGDDSDIYVLSKDDGLIHQMDGFTNTEKATVGLPTGYGTIWPTGRWQVIGSGMVDNDTRWMALYDNAQDLTYPDSYWHCQYVEMAGMDPTPTFDLRLEMHLPNAYWGSLRWCAREPATGRLVGVASSWNGATGYEDRIYRWKLSDGLVVGGIPTSTPAPNANSKYVGGFLDLVNQWIYLFNTDTKRLYWYDYTTYTAAGIADLTAEGSILFDTTYPRGAYGVHYPDPEGNMWMAGTQAAGVQYAYRYLGISNTEINGHHFP